MTEGTRKRMYPLICGSDRQHRVTDGICGGRIIRICLPLCTATIGVAVPASKYLTGGVGAGSAELWLCRHVYARNFQRKATLSHSMCRTTLAVGATQILVHTSPSVSAQ